MRPSRRDFLIGSSVMGLAAAGALPAWAAGDEMLKVGVVYVSPMVDHGWTKQHSLAAAAVEQALPGKVEVTAIENVSQPQNAERVFHQLASTGHRLIFGTSFSHGTPMQKVAPRFPQVAFEHCSGLRHLPNLGTFEAKYYEGTYLAGIAAGGMTKTGKIGFIGGFPIPDIVGPANALLLGARSVDPAITCSVIFLNSWFDPGKEKDAAETLVAQGCDVICSMTDTAVGVQTAEEKGAWSVGYASDMSRFGPTRHLTAFTLDWSGAYVQAARDVLAGTWESRTRWLGLGDGVVRMAPYNPSIPHDVLDLLARTQAGIEAGRLHPYAGEIRDQEGKVRVPAGTVMADADIRAMNWFVDGMNGWLKG